MFGDKLKFVPIAKSSVSFPGKALLKHKGYITLKLEKIYKQEMRIKIIRSDFSQGFYQREIVMSGAKDAIPRELAHIKVLMENLNAKIRKEVLEGKKPFGKILSENKVLSKKEIKCFFKVYKNDYILKYARNKRSVFYGRSSFIFLANSKKILAQVTEIFL